MQPSTARVRRVLRTVTVVAATTALAVPAAAWASHVFTDVSDGDFYASAVTWAKDNGITNGCNPSQGNTRFCPDDTVTRGVMAIFLRNLATSRAVDAGTLDGKDSTDFADADHTHVALVDVASSTTAQWAATTSLEPLTGASATVTVPSGHTAIIEATFSGESACSSGNGYCVVVLYANGSAMDPASGIDFAFDSTDSGNNTASSWESHTMVRTATVGAGTYTITVEFAGTGGGTTLRLDDWTLFVQAHLTS